MLSIWSVLLYLVIAIQVVAYEVCYETSSYEYYCPDGQYCCNNNNKCCYGSRTDSETTVSGGAIAGIIIGSIAGVIILCCICSQCAKKCNKPSSNVVPNPTIQQPPTYSYNLAYTGANYGHPGEHYGQTGANVHPAEYNVGSTGQPQTNPEYPPEPVRY